MLSKIKITATRIEKIVTVLFIISLIIVAVAVVGIFITALMPIEEIDGVNYLGDIDNPVITVSPVGFDLRNIDFGGVEPQDIKALMLVTNIFGVLTLLLLSAKLFLMKNIATTLKHESPFSEILGKYIKYLVILTSITMILGEYSLPLLTNAVLTPFFGHLIFPENAPLAFLKDELVFQLDVFVIVEIMGLLLIYYCAKYAIKLQKQADETL